MSTIEDRSRTRAIADNWGPWAVAISAGERLARLRSMRALVHAFYGARHKLTMALLIAESQEPADLAAARTELDSTPTRDQRKILATYASMIAMKAQASARRSS